MDIEIDFICLQRQNLSKNSQVTLRGLGFLNMDPSLVLEQLTKFLGSSAFYQTEPVFSSIDLCDLI
jgi:hypothetical protein